MESLPVGPSPDALLEPLLSSGPLLLEPLLLKLLLLKLLLLKPLLLSSGPVEPLLVVAPFPIGGAGSTKQATEQIAMSAAAETADFIVARIAYRNQRCLAPRTLQEKRKLGPTEPPL